MTAMTFETAKNIGIAVAVGLVALMLVLAMVIKNVTAKLITIVLVGGLAFGVWTQRSSLQDCADQVKDRAALGDTSDVVCSFLGSDITINASSCRDLPGSHPNQGGPTLRSSGSTTADLNSAGWLSGAS